MWHVPMLVSTLHTSSIRGREARHFIQLEMLTYTFEGASSQRCFGPSNEGMNGLP
jgi:hypothetical protein